MIHILLVLAVYAVWVTVLLAGHRRRAREAIQVAAKATDQTRRACSDLDHYRWRNAKLMAANAELRKMVEPYRGGRRRPITLTKEEAESIGLALGPIGVVPDVPKGAS